jgi:hypothetical protein
MTQKKPRRAMEMEGGTEKSMSSLGNEEVRPQPRDAGPLAVSEANKPMRTVRWKMVAEEKGSRMNHETLMILRTWQRHHGVSPSH